MLALSAAVLFPGKASADLPSPFLSGAVEMWSGGEATRHAWSVWAGINWSPLGKIEDSGVRVRLSGGSGQYRYTGRVDGVQQSIYGTAAFADLLAGYQINLGNVTLKLFAGGTFDGHLLQPCDEANKVNFAATGAKAVAEAWINVTPSAFAQIDLSGATAHNSYAGRLRLGYRLTRRLALGLEGGAFGNRAADNLRAGLFARYEWLGGEISASGGVAGDIAARRNPYGGLVYLKRF